MTAVQQPSAHLPNGAQSTVRRRVNSHIHLPPNFSAFETVVQAVELAAAQDVRVLGVSNYYDYSVYDTFAVEAHRRQVFPLYGIEIITLIDDLMGQGVKINDPGNPGKMYVCGKGISQFNPLSETAQQLLQVIRDNDSERMARVTTRLAELFAENGLETGLDAKAIKDRVVARHGSPRETVYLQERHAAQAFQEILFEKLPLPERVAFLERLFGRAPANPADAVSVQNEIRGYLMKAGKPAYVAETFVDFEHAYRLILALGGIPCYPTLADGAKPLCPYEADVEELIRRTRDRGIYCAEFIPVRNTVEVFAHYARAMREAGFFVTAGTEHNTLDLLPIEPTCLNGAPIPEDVREILWEGACVVAGHQVSRQNGQPGFVDEEGRLNPEYPSEHARIEAFRRVGEEAIEEYVG